jgi:hypothetical protein
MRALATHPCRGLCRWSAADEHRDGQRIFSCAGCTSEWISSEPWTPINADGTIPMEVAAERD